MSADPENSHQNLRKLRAKEVHSRATLCTLAGLGMHVQTALAVAQTAGAIMIQCKPRFWPVSVEDQLAATFGLSTPGINEEARVCVLQVAVGAEGKHEGRSVIHEESSNE